MRHMQDKILDAIEEALTTEHTEVVRKGVWANTGRIFAQPKEGFTTFLTIYYTFDDSRFDLHIYGDAVQGFAVEHLARNYEPDGRALVEDPRGWYAPPGFTTAAIIPDGTKSAHELYVWADYTEGDRIAGFIEAIREIVELAKEAV